MIATDLITTDTSHQHGCCERLHNDSCGTVIVHVVLVGIVGTTLRIPYHIRSRQSNFIMAFNYLKTRYIYRQISNIRRVVVGNKNVNHSDVVGASPVGAAPTTSSFAT